MPEDLSIVQATRAEIEHNQGYGTAHGASGAKWERHGVHALRLVAAICLFNG